MLVAQGYGPNTAVTDESISSLLQQIGLDVSSGLHLWNDLQNTGPDSYSEWHFEGKYQTWEIKIISQ